MLAIVDTGPLLTVADGRDPRHEAVVAVLARPDLMLVIPAMVVAETTYLIAKRFGPEFEARFLARMSNYEVEAPHREDWARIAELVQQYRDFPIGGTDASVIALAERLDTDLIITLDRRHFAAIKPRHAPGFRILPE